MNILQEADNHISGDRQEDYGHPSKDLPKIAALWSAYKGVEFEAKDVAMMMVLLKVSRERNKHKRDNLTDIAGWSRAYEMCLDIKKDIKGYHDVAELETTHPVNCPWGCPPDKHTCGRKNND